MKLDNTYNTIITWVPIYAVFFDHLGLRNQHVAFVTVKRGAFYIPPEKGRKKSTSLKRKLVPGCAKTFLVKPPVILWSA